MHIGVEVAHVVCVAVSQAGGGQAAAVVVDHHRAEHDLVAAVEVDVGNRVVVVALAVPRAAGRVAVPGPALGERVGGWVHVVGNHLVAGVDAAGQEDAGLAAVEIWRAEEVLRRAVAVAVAPCGAEVGLASLESGQRIGQFLIDLAGQAVEIEQIFGAGVGEGHGRGAHKVVAHGVRGAVGHVDDHGIGSAQDALGTAVAVPVVGGDVDFVALEVGHVGAAVYPPELGAVERVALDDVELGAVGRIAGCGVGDVAELDEQLHAAVAVEVGYGGVVGLEFGGERAVVRHYLQIVALPHGRCGARRLLGAAHHGLHRVLRRGAATCVGEVGDGDGLGRQEGPVAVDVVGHVVVFFAGDAPAAEHAG